MCLITFSMLQQSGQYSTAATRLAYSCILIRTYGDLTFLFLSEVYDLFQLLCVLSSAFICFPPEVTFRSRVIGACSVTTDCIVAMSECENNNSKYAHFFVCCALKKVREQL